MQLRCYRCGWSFAIKQEEAAFALEALEESGGNHYDTRCPRCRHSNRVSLEQLREAAPKIREEEPEASAEVAGDAAEPIDETAVDETPVDETPVEES